MAIEVFVSHSTYDTKIATKVYDLLHEAIQGLEREQIRITCVPASRPFGDISAGLLDEIRTAPAFIPIYSSCALLSQYFLMEVGARWASADSKQPGVFPLYVPGTYPSDAVIEMERMQMTSTADEVEIRAFVSAIAAALDKKTKPSEHWSDVVKELARMKPTECKPKPAPYALLALILAVIAIFVGSLSVYRHFSIISLMPPVGSIIAWHRDIQGAGKPLSLPEGWVVCTNPTMKEVVTDQRSNLYGMPIPDLNSTHQSWGGGRFLRGSTTSGTLQDDAFKSHVHKASKGMNFQFMSETPKKNQMPGSDAGYDYPWDPFTGEPKEGASSETRPVNMSVVWIMRIY